jgi:hypothetical protein
MSLLGKIIAILNVVAATVFLVVAWLDWAQRERWAYAVFRHDLLVEGLPIDDKELDQDLHPRVNKLRASTLDEIFQAAGGSHVKTQTEEVNRLRSLVQSKIDGAPNKGQALARFLHPLARTYLERDNLAQFMASNQITEAQTAELQRRLDQQFDGVITPGGKQTLEERKANAARLLFCLGEVLDAGAEQPTAYKRFLVISGLAAAAREVDAEASLLQQMTGQAILAHEAERAQFLYDHNQVVGQSQNLADAWDRQALFLKAKKEEADAQDQLVKERTAQIEDLAKQLDKLRQDTRTKLDEQAKLEEAVMKGLIDLRDTAKKNQELERQIRELEGLPAER